ncbi:tRNA epoxyqueuosine(34) reductase QueG [Pseudovibrio exalbescens]|uniref:tRNA epoxyqueuosine(34) reductase QueG n=1 Tax=Pseudovibrio exalbescens TaxID=197461 RepID=UPI002366AE41|nr:tRNA epoxyqueuosine(34) reductase QueG [Pseudovibrio exalbescens]MDD7909817.1 tRNA epoxyqueuosine(34) reductase QueG [Pseudovibrio exalbescens]
MLTDRQLNRVKADLISRAKALGFSEVRITRPDSIPLAPERLRSFIEAGYHASMDWMPETEERRADPRALWPEVNSVIMLAMNYGPEENPLYLLEKPEKAAISVYARNRDYHDIIKGKLKELASLVVSRGGGDVKVFVDTAPVMEKPLAHAAGLGWQGKHTNLVSRELGSWFFLGSIFSTLELPADEAEVDHCGRCRRCLDACPTNAFPSPYKIDANRCISYLTIEHHGPIPHEFRKPMANRIYGCDDCLGVCPWNKFAQEASEAKLQAREDLKEPEIRDLLQLDDPTFRKFFSGSPIKRIGRDRFIRNTLIAAGNSGQPDLLELVVGLLEDPAPVVRGAAVWALGQLAQSAEVAALKERHVPQEPDETVLEEWAQLTL